MTQHTPTPWEKEAFDIQAGGVYIAGARTQEDASHIVKCVNLHDELVGALRFARNDLFDHLRAGTLRCDSCKTRVEEINELLSKAGAL